MDQARAPGGRIAIVGIVAALALVVLADVVASLAGVDVDWTTSIVTALVVAGFLVLILVRPKNKKPRVEGGFTVEE